MAMAAYSAIEDRIFKSREVKGSSLIRLISSMTPKILASVLRGVPMMEWVLNPVYLSTRTLNRLSFATSLIIKDSPVSMICPAIPSPLGSFTPCSFFLFVPTTTEKIMSEVFGSFNSIDQCRG